MYNKFSISVIVNGFFFVKKSNSEVLAGHNDKKNTKKSHIQ